MIPFINFKNNDNPECQFIHANGFPPFAYSSLLNLLSNNLHINAMLLRPHWEDDNGIEKLNNWNLFLEDFEKYINENNVISTYGIGHSIGGNLLLRACINNNNLFKSIVLLDPTIFIPSIVYLWKFVNYIPHLNSFFPLAKSARNRRKVFNNKDDVFQSYKNKKIFSNIPEEQLKEYIDSIFTYNENTKKVHLNYRRRWEEKIYLKSLLMDMDIWNNIDKLQTPTLIITPELNPVFRFSASRKILSNKYISIKSIKNSTHLFPLEKPNTTSELIKQFLLK